MGLEVESLCFVCVSKKNEVRFRDNNNSVVSNSRGELTITTCLTGSSRRASVASTRVGREAGEEFGMPIFKPSFLATNK